MGRKGRLSVVVAGMASLPASARRAALYRRAVTLAFATARRPRTGEVNVVFLERAAMRRMNRHYLGHDYDTDVISFPHELPPGVREKLVPLGDVFVSSWMVRRQARELGHSPSFEAATLAVHGALHLLGHDDHAPKAKKRMFAVQDRVVASLKP